MNNNTTALQWKVRSAIQIVQSKYHKNPWIFMTEADVQCAIYSELSKHVSKARKTISCDIYGSKINANDFQLLTNPLHAELATSRRKSTEFVDLCLLVPCKVYSVVKKRKYNRNNNELSIWEFLWEPKDSIGIEIKFNRWIPKISVYSRLTKRLRITEQWKYHRRRLIQDISKLKRYKRGWLIFVDHHSLFRGYDEWRTFMEKIIRDSNYGRAKKTLNAYYLCPKHKRALSFKSPGKSF